MHTIPGAFDVAFLTSVGQLEARFPGQLPGSGWQLGGTSAATVSVGLICWLATLAPRPAAEPSEATSTHTHIFRIFQNA